jgi:hypothetical protein
VFDPFQSFLPNAIIAVPSPWWCIDVFASASRFSKQSFESNLLVH